MGYRDGPNLYQYVRSRPIVRTDPSGLISSTCGNYADAGRGISGPNPPIVYVGCLGNTLPPWADWPTNPEKITWQMDKVQSACRGKCPQITINCISTCNEAYADGCTLNIGPPCNPAMNRGSYTYHELEHIYQYCTAGDISDCDDRICRELDAYLSAGQCAKMRLPARQPVAAIEPVIPFSTIHGAFGHTQIA